MMVQRVRFPPWKVMMGDASKETGKVPIGKNPSSGFTISGKVPIGKNPCSVFPISRLSQDDEIGNVSYVIRSRMKKNKKGKTRILPPYESFIFHVGINKFLVHQTTHQMHFTTSFTTMSPSILFVTCASP